MIENSAFERRQIAQIVGASYALVKNWSNGKTFEIIPSVKAPTERGATKLYSLSQVYLMAITVSLKRQGMHPDFVRKLLPILKSDWFRKEKRGIVIYGHSTRGKVKAAHVMVGLRANPIATVMYQSKAYVGGWLDLKRTLDHVDKMIEKKSWDLN